MRTTVTVPFTFWDDHLQRECVDDHYEAVRKGNRITVTLSDRDLADLLSDADYYADDPEFDALGKSARRTKNALIKQIGLESLAVIWVQAGNSRRSGQMIGLPCLTTTTHRQETQS